MPIGPQGHVQASAAGIQTANQDECLESIAAGRGVGVVSALAAQRTIHPSSRFLPLTDAPPSSVSILFVLGYRDPMTRRFVEAAVTATQRRTN